MEGTESGAHFKTPKLSFKLCDSCSSSKWYHRGHFTLASWVLRAKLLLLGVGGWSISTISTHPQAPIEFYRLLVCITSNTVVLNYLPIPQTLNMCCSYKIHHKRRQQRQRWLAGPAKERDDDQVASTSPEMSSVPLSVLPCITIHQRPYPLLTHVLMFLHNMFVLSCVQLS